MADPAARAQAIATRQANGNALNAEQLAQISRQIAAGATPAEIADDWLIRADYARRLAAKLGLHFQTKQDRFRTWASSRQDRLTVAAVMVGMGCSRATAYRWLKQLDAERGGTA